MKGEIWWFAVPGSIQAEHVIKDLNERGFAYRHPTAATDRMIYLDTEGDRHEGTVDEVIDLFESDLVTSMLWLDADTNVLFGPDDVLHRWTFDLDGLDWSEAQRVAFAVVACALGTPGTLGVVVDRNLPDNYEEWIRCFDHGTAIPYEPDLLLLASTAGNHNHALILRPDSWITHPQTSPSPPPANLG